MMAPLDGSHTGKGWDPGRPLTGAVNAFILHTCQRQRWPLGCHGGWLSLFTVILMLRSPLLCKEFSARVLSVESGKYMPPNNVRSIFTHETGKN